MRDRGGHDRLAGGLEPLPGVKARMADQGTEPKGPDFEAALEELETLVARLEEGDLSLEESLRCFERGVHLTRTCQTALKDAEQKVEALVRQDGDWAAVPFSEGEGAGDDA